MKSFIYGLIPYLLMILGTIVLYGWESHYPQLLQVHPDWPPMNPWTALCFFLTGFGLLSRGLFRKMCGLCVLIVSLIMLGEYTLGSSLWHFDQALCDPWLGRAYAQDLFPGRMAMTTAACFFLSSCRLLSHLDKLLCGATIGILGSASCLWYFGSAAGLSVGPWGPWSDMAAHTGMAMCLIGLYIIEGRDDSPFPIPEQKLIKLLEAN